MLKKILLLAPEDPKASSSVDLAVDLARQHEASITGFVAVDEERLSSVGPTPVGAFSYRVAMVHNRLERGSKSAEDSMSRLADICSASNVPFIADKKAGKQAVRLVNAWRFQDLAIMSTRIWTPGLIEPDDAETILHFVAMGLRPLLVVPQDYDKRPEKALVALSGSLESAKSFKHFVQMQLFGQMPLHIVTVGLPKSGESPEALLHDASDYARAHGYPVTTAALPPSESRVQLLLDHASEVGTDLTVVGSSYRHFLVFTRFGSHATGLLNRSKCPVFVSH